VRERDTAAHHDGSADNFAADADIGRHHFLALHAAFEAGNKDAPGAEIHILTQQQPHLGGSQTK